MRFLGMTRSSLGFIVARKFFTCSFNHVLAYEGLGPLLDLACLRFTAPLRLEADMLLALAKGTHFGYFDLFSPFDLPQGGNEPSERGLAMSTHLSFTHCLRPFFATLFTFRFNSTRANTSCIHIRISRRIYFEFPFRSSFALWWWRTT